MKLDALLTSAGINIGLCVFFISLYSVVRKQPSNLYVYFGRSTLTQERKKSNDSFKIGRILPTPAWILEAWGPTEDEILASVGLDAVVFLRMIVFSIRIFSIAFLICMFGVLPLNYYGQEMTHNRMARESLEVFTIVNVKEGSQWLWFHCLALHIISFSACTLLYFEYQRISKLRLDHVIACPPKLSHFTILVRSIPRLEDMPRDDAIKVFFITYHGMSYLSHQRIYQSGAFHKFMTNAEKLCRKFVPLRALSFNFKRIPAINRCGLCGGTSRSYDLHDNAFDIEERRTPLSCSGSGQREEDSSAALVFFKTRQLWIRRLSIVVATILFLFLFLIPVTFVQGLTQLDTLQQKLPFLRGILTKKYMIQLVTGYLPSVILLVFFYSVPPIMMLFSTVEGAISRSGRKKSACCKVLYFTIWNVFFVNVLSASVIHQLMFISQPKDIPFVLARTLPGQATFFITYVLTSGWTSLCAELVQCFSLTYNLLQKHVFRKKADDPNKVPTFPYHTEVPRVLLFGLLGFTCSILAPLILPFLMVYFSLGYLVYRNQMLNVYRTKYESGGQLWPVVHNTTIFSLVLAQIIALGVFGLKKSTVASGFMIPLVIFTLLFHEYCRKRFLPIFKKFSAQALVEMDRQDEMSGKMEEIHKLLQSAYCQTATIHEDELVDGCSREDN
ncbi:CSC1-like protein RXW8 isoform X2 [Phalaenopsis equestris]|uniref:CSC1-like protein RXW8 isoform X2 n=1 Tax=Phalaenopsis equestris TaxID=78828 RepID=UPI0009E4CA95|nr:CSC1-like protein RXW8 isoform X2 [Phalaenopsis equestris]